MTHDDQIVHDAVRETVCILRRSVRRRRTMSLPNVIRFYHRRVASDVTADTIRSEKGETWLREFYLTNQPFDQIAWRTLINQIQCGRTQA